MQTGYKLPAGARLHGWLRRNRLKPLAEPRPTTNPAIDALPTMRMTGPIPQTLVTQAEAAAVRLRERETDKTATFVMPAITAHKAVKLPPYLEYRRPDDSPLTLLYAASVAAVHAFDRLPDILFISHLTEELLGQEYYRMTGKLYDGHFRLFNPATPGNIEVIPVFTDNLLPDILRAIVGPVGRDTVIVMQEG